MSDEIRRLIKQASAHAAEVVEEAWEESIGDSPIEKLLYAALRSTIILSNSETKWMYHLDDWSKAAMAKAEHNFCWGSIIIEPQVKFEWGRADFVIHAYDFGVKGAAPGWRKLVIECDGHEFHERTKEQAKKDRSRDRAAQMGRLEVFRFTGSEIWNDPWGCAEQILQWASRGWP